MTTICSELLLFRPDTFEVDIQILQDATDKWLDSQNRHGVKCQAASSLDGGCEWCKDIHGDSYYGAKLLAIINDEPWPRPARSMDFRPKFSTVSTTTTSGTSTFTGNAKVRYNRGGIVK